MKERREVWGIYDWSTKEWWDGPVAGKRLVFNDPCEAIRYGGELSNSSVRRFFLVKKSNPRAELTKRVIDAAREYSKYMGGRPSGPFEQYKLWVDLSDALEKYDGV